MMPRLRYFTEKEVVNPVFDSNPANCWDDMPKTVQFYMHSTLQLLDELRSELGYSMIINSTWRPKDRLGKPHRAGKAVDFQFISSASDNIYLKFMNIIPKLVGDLQARYILEWRGRRPWVHIDRNWRVGKYGKNPVLLVAFPKNNKMVYQTYRGELPQEYVNKE